MAAARHNLTRRAVLGAAALLCAPAIGGRARAGAPRRPWERALAAFRLAEARVARLPRDASDEYFGEVDGARFDALRWLLRVPAPDLRALSLKVDLAIDEEVATLTDGELCLAALKADARRLADEG